jgi:YbbR domain-containing protein
MKKSDFPGSAYLKPTWGRFLNDLFAENLSYKLVSLFIALILWLTILGRRDFIFSKNVEVDVLVGVNYILAGQNVERVRVKVSGPRTALKKFMDSGLSQQVTVDATHREEGEYEIEIPRNKIDVPFGVSVQQVRPATVKVIIKKAQ